jgi:sporulation protein YlmC with PRC-barrel domain
MHIDLDDLPGRSVVDATGRVLGEVDGLLLDTQSWTVDLLRVKLRRSTAEEFSLAWSPFKAPTIDIPTQLVMAASDAVVLRASLEELQGLTADAASSHASAGAAHG